MRKRRIGAFRFIGLAVLALVAVSLIFTVAYRGDNEDATVSPSGGNGSGQFDPQSTPLLWRALLRSAIESFNGGYTPVLLRDTISGGGGTERCGISVVGDGRDGAVLTVIAYDGSWLQVKIESDGTVPEKNISLGLDFRSAIHGQALDDYFSDAAECDVSPTGSVSLR